MKKRIVVVVWIVLLMISLTACNFAYGRDFERVIEGDFIVLDFADEDKELYIEGLSEEGKQKEIIVVPEFLRGKPVKGFNHTVSKNGPSNCYWKSEKLKKVYIVPYFTGPARTLSSSFNCPNLKGIFYINQRITINQKMYAKAFYSRKWHEENDFSEEDKANISYYWNYEGNPNDGYYWLDYVDYGELVDYIPEVPIREGYNFGGWYKEPECENMWDFEMDFTPQEILDEYSYVAIYQETILYAKWVIK